jgi:hypothetical protein
MKLSITEAVSLSIVVGSGGSGGSYTGGGLLDGAKSGSPGTNGGNTSVTWSSKSITLTARGGFGGGGNDTIVAGGSGGTYTLPTASGTIYKTGKGESGAKGDNGSLKRDVKTQGGKAGAITNTGSLSSFGGGVGAVRQSGGNKQTGDRGGGGSGGYDANYGVAGGNGEVRIIVKY